MLITLQIIPKLHACRPLKNAHAFDTFMKKVQCSALAENKSLALACLVCTSHPLVFWNVLKYGFWRRNKLYSWQTHLFSVTYSAFNTFNKIIWTPILIGFNVICVGQYEKPTLWLYFVPVNTVGQGFLIFLTPFDPIVKYSKASISLTKTFLTNKIF